MKIKGKAISAPEPLECTILRGEEPITFRCGAVIDYADFDTICPEPNVPVRTDIATGQKTKEFDSKDYVSKIEKRAKLRSDWTVIKSISFTEGLEWEHVNLDDPATWHKWRSELESVMTEFEVQKIEECVIEANAPSERRIKEAIDAFQRSQAQAETSSSDQEEHGFTESGELANA